MNRIIIAVMVLGVFCGLGGASHGPGEILQGNVAPTQLFIEAWPSLIALNGEPAMTVIPSFLISGVLTVIVGVLIAGWSLKFLHTKFSGLVLIVLSVVLLLVGGGLVPPFFGFAAGLLAQLNSYRMKGRINA